MKRLLLLLAILFPVAAFSQNAPYSGFCTQGAAQAASSGLLSTNYLQGVVPMCRVTVFLTGTQTPATIYSNATGTALTNPFTAAFNGQWSFYAAPSSIYDVVLSGGNYPNYYPAPVTLVGVPPGSGGLSSAVVSINGNPGPFSFNGAGVACSGNTCTFTGGTGSGTVVPSNIGLTAVYNQQGVGQVIGSGTRDASVFPSVAQAIATGSPVNIPLGTFGDTSQYKYGQANATCFTNTLTGQLTIKPLYFGYGYTSAPNVTAVAKAGYTGTATGITATVNSLGQVTAYTIGGTNSGWSTSNNFNTICPATITIDPPPIPNTPVPLLNSNFQSNSYNSITRVEDFGAKGDYNSQIVTISAITRLSSGLVTATLLTPATYFAGNNISVTGVTDTSFNGTFTLSSIPNGTTLTWFQSGTATASTGGSIAVIPTDDTFAVNAAINFATANGTQIGTIAFTEGKKYCIECLAPTTGPGYTGQYPGAGDDGVLPNTAQVSVTGATTCSVTSPGSGLTIKNVTLPSGATGTISATLNTTSHTITACSVTGATGFPYTALVGNTCGGGLCTSLAPEVPANVGVGILMVNLLRIQGNGATLVSGFSGNYKAGTTISSWTGDGTNACFNGTNVFEAGQRVYLNGFTSALGAAFNAPFSSWTVNAGVTGSQFCVPSTVTGSATETASAAGFNTDWPYIATIGTGGFGNNANVSRVTIRDLNFQNAFIAIGNIGSFTKVDNISCANCGIIVQGQNSQYSSVNNINAAEGPSGPQTMGGFFLGGQYASPAPYTGVNGASVQNSFDLADNFQSSNFTMSSNGTSSNAQFNVLRQALDCYVDQVWYQVENGGVTNSDNCFTPPGGIVRMTDQDIAQQTEPDEGWRGIYGIPYAIYGRIGRPVNSVIITNLQAKQISSYLIACLPNCNNHSFTNISPESSGGGNSQVASTLSYGSATFPNPYEPMNYTLPCEILVDSPGEDDGVTVLGSYSAAECLPPNFSFSGATSTSQTIAQVTNTNGNPVPTPLNPIQQAGSVLQSTNSSTPITDKQQGGAKIPGSSPITYTPSSHYTSANGFLNQQWNWQAIETKYQPGAPSILELEGYYNSSPLAGQYFKAPGLIVNNSVMSGGQINAFTMTSLGSGYVPNSIARCDIAVSSTLAPGSTTDFYRPDCSAVTDSTGAIKSSSTSPSCGYHCGVGYGAVFATAFNIASSSSVTITAPNTLSVGQTATVSTISGFSNVNAQCLNGLALTVTSATNTNFVASMTSSCTASSGTDAATLSIAAPAITFQPPGSEWYTCTSSSGVPAASCVLRARGIGLTNTTVLATNSYSTAATTYTYTAGATPTLTTFGGAGYPPIWNVYVGSNGGTQATATVTVTGIDTEGPIEHAATCRFFLNTGGTILSNTYVTLTGLSCPGARFNSGNTSAGDWLIPVGNGNAAGHPSFGLLQVSAEVTAANTISLTLKNDTQNSIAVVAGTAANPYIMELHSGNKEGVILQAGAAHATGPSTFPTGTTLLPTSASGVASINGSTGAFTFTGSGVTCTTTTCTFTGTGTGVSSFSAPSASWPTWLVPTVTNSTTTPSLAVAASAIPNSALANVFTTVNGQNCTLGSTCTVNTPASLTMNNSGAGSASGSVFNGSTALTISYNTIGAAPLASPTFTGTPAAPTATAGTNTTQIASTAFVQAAVSAISAVTGSGTTNTVPKFTGASAVGNSSITDDGTKVATTEIIQSAGSVTTGTTQGPLALGVGTGTITLPAGSPTNYVGFLGPTSGTPAYFMQLPSSTPNGNVMSCAAPTTVNGVSQSVCTWTSAGGGTTTNAVTFNNSGSGASSGTTFNGSAAITVSTNTIGAATVASNTFTGTQQAPIFFNSGTSQTSGNISLTGWGSGAAVSSVSGFGQRFRFTITAGTTPAANPTFVATLPTTFPSAPICIATQTGGTGVFSDISSGTESTTSTGTITWNGTPTNTLTYIITVDCR